MEGRQGVGPSGENAAGRALGSWTSNKSIFKRGRFRGATCKQAQTCFGEKSLKDVLRAVAPRPALDTDTLRDVLA